MPIKNKGNNRIGKTRNLAKKLRDIKGIFHANMGTIKDKSGMNLAEAENVMKCWQEYKRRTVPMKGLKNLLLLLLLLLSCFSQVWLFGTPWTAPYQAPPSMEFSRHEYCSGLPFPSHTRVIAYVNLQKYYWMNPVQDNTIYVKTKLTLKLPLLSSG